MNLHRILTPREAGRMSPLPDGWDLDEIMDRLRDKGIFISLDRALRAQATLAQLARHGTQMTRPEAANWLAALLCASRDDAALLRAELAPSPRVEAATGQQIGAVVAMADRNLLLMGAGVLIAVVLLFAGLYFGLEDLPWIGDVAVPDVVDNGAVVPLPDTGGGAVADPGLVVEETIPPADRVFRFLISDFLLPLYILLPFLLLSWLLLWGRSAQRAALVRQTGEGTLFKRLPVPVSSLQAPRDHRVRRAIETYKAPRLQPGQRLDVRAVVRSAARTPGALELSYLDEKRNTEYLILAEGRSVNAHRRMVIRRIQRRLAQSDTAYAQYDLGASSTLASFAEGKRDGPEQEELSQILRRYRGGRLLLFGTAQEILARDRRAAEGVKIADMIDTYEIVIALVTLPKGRWGRSERRLMDKGVVLHEASDTGFVASSASLAALQIEQRRAQRPPERRRDDPFVTQLVVNRTRYLSDNPPDEEEITALVLQINGFLGSREGVRLFAALAAVPGFDSDMTLYLSEVVLGEPLEDGLAMRLAALPWCDANRIPDWLRLEVLRALPEAERVALRDTLTVMFAELLEGGGARPLSGSTIDVMRSLGLEERVAQRMNLGQGNFPGEAVFLRFLRDELAEELDQEIGEITPAPKRSAIAASIAVMLLGLLCMSLFRDQIPSFITASGNIVELTLLLLPLLLPYTISLAFLRRNTAFMRRYKWGLWPGALGIYAAGLFFSALMIAEVDTVGADVHKEGYLPSLLLLLLPVMTLFYHLQWDQKPRAHRPAKPTARPYGAFAAVLGYATLLAVLLFHPLMDADSSRMQDTLIVWYIPVGTVCFGALTALCGDQPLVARALERNAGFLTDFVGKALLNALVILGVPVSALAGMFVIQISEPSPSVVIPLLAAGIALALWLQNRDPLWRLALLLLLVTIADTATGKMFDDLVTQLLNLSSPTSYYASGFAMFALACCIEAVIVFALRVARAQGRPPATKPPDTGPETKEPSMRRKRSSKSSSDEVDFASW